jgi:hypothetical protein
MKDSEIYENLCAYDPRNPYYEVLKGAFVDDLPKPREEGCACDTCFYGRDVLAMEILKLKGE